MSMSRKDPDADSTAFATALIVTWRRPEMLAQCLESLKEALSGVNALPRRIDTLVVVNGDCAASLAVLQKWPEVQVVICPSGAPGAARNFGLLHAQGEFVLFLDDDVIIPSDYFGRFSELLAANPKAGVIGGPDATHPEAGVLEHSIGLALRSPLATARTRYRHSAGSPPCGKEADEKILILCNLWIRLRIFSEVGHRFDERFFRNEENVLLQSLSGIPMVFSPLLAVFHRRKTSLFQFARGVFFSGYYRAKTAIFFPGSTGIEFFVPTLFVAFLMVAPFFGRWPVWSILWIYAAFNIFFAARLSLGIPIRRRWLGFELIAVYQFGINLFYGLGFAFGLTSFFSPADPYTGSGARRSLRDQSLKAFPDASLSSSAKSSP